jgi:hypothetical protein
MGACRYSNQTRRAQRSRRFPDHDATSDGHIRRPRCLRILQEEWDLAGRHADRQRDQPYQNWTDCDKNTFVCSTSFGSGIFQASYIGMGMMVKDSKRFPARTRQLGYFAFRSNGSAYQDTASVRPQQQCASCHMKLASNTVYVFSSTHIGLLPGNTQ